MKPAWVDRAVFYVTEDASDPGLARLGFNTLCLVRKHHAIEPATQRLIGDAQRRDVRVCVDLSDLAAGRTSDSIAAWHTLGIDGFVLNEPPDPSFRFGDDVCVIVKQQAVQRRIVSSIRTTLFRSAEGQGYFDSHGSGDFEAFWRVFEPLHRLSGPDARIALSTSEVNDPPLADGRESDDLEVIYTFLFTWPIVPFVHQGDESRGSTQLEKLVYLRLTAPELLPDASLRLLSPVSPGYPLVYRRGESIVVALNPGNTARRVDLDAVGDAAPLVAHHCHLAYTHGRWSARLGPAGYGVFNVT